MFSACLLQGKTFGTSPLCLERVSTANTHLKAQIKSTEKPRDTLILPQTHPDCELVFSKCSVTPRWVAFAYFDKSATTGLLCCRVQQRQNCIDQITHPETHAPPQNVHDAL